MEELSKVSLNNIKNLSRVDAENIKQEILGKIEGGFINALEVNMFFKFLAKLYDGDDKKNNGLSDLIKDSCNTEFSFYGDKTLRLGAFEISENEAGGRFDFSKDKKWLELNEKVKEVTAIQKERETFLKGIPDGKPVEEVDQDSGEVVRTFRPVKVGGSGSGLKYTFKG